MGGQEGARGYLIQAMVCVLDGLDDRSDWLSVTIEPNDESEKVDILWQFEDYRKAVQVKSSQNPFTLPMTKRWAEELERSTTAAICELRLLGPCTDGVANIGKIGNVKVPVPEVVNLNSLLQQAAHKLDCYLARRLPHMRVGPLARELIAGALSNRLGTLSTNGSTLSRNELDALLAGWLRETCAELNLPEPDSGMVDIDGFLRRFRVFQQHSLPLLVGTYFEVDGGRKSSTDLLDFFGQGEHAQLVGPSGYGKTHLVRHMALTASKAGVIAIIARGIEYRGNLAEILDRGVAAFCPCIAANLFSAAFQSQRPVVIVLDGFNECPSTLQEHLLLELQAYHLRWHASIILTSQAVQNLSPELTGRVISACELENPQRHEILKCHHHGELPHGSDELCRPFKSAFELSVAAQCLEEIHDTPNRTGLFEAYLRARSRGRIDVAVLRRALSAIADVMRRQLRSSLPLPEIYRLAESVLDQHQVPVTGIQAIMDSSFLNVNQGVCTFRHELLQRFFEATALSRSTADLNCLVQELLRPVHHSLIEFVLGMEANDERFLALLYAVSHVSTSFDGINDCLNGRFGQSVNAAIRKTIGQLFCLAHEELDVIALKVVDVESSGRPRQTFELNGQRIWSSFECALWRAIARQIPHGDFLDESMHLIARTENVILGRLTEIIGESAIRRKSIQSRILSDFFVLGLGTYQERLPAYILVREADFLWRSGADLTTRLAERCASPSELSNSELYLLLKLSSVKNPEIEQRLPALLQRGWESGAYHLQLQTLMYVQRWANPFDAELPLKKATRDSIEQLLRGFETNNVFLNSQLVETMTSFNLLELAMTPEDVRSQLIEILTRPDDSEYQQLASNAVSNIFEDVFQGVYSDAIDGLSNEQKGKLFLMAALGAESYSMSATYVLEELLHDPPADAAPAFERFATEIDGDSCFPQETTRLFILAHQGSALYFDRPLQLKDLGTNDRKAWQCYGEIFYWLAKEGVSDSDVDDKCAVLFAILSQDLRYAAVDPLMRFASTLSWGKQKPNEHPVYQLFNRFRSPIRLLLEGGMQERNKLTSIDTRQIKMVDNRERLAFMIRTLGQIGDCSTVTLISPFVDDEYHGQTAVDAIRSLNSGRISNSMSLR